MNTKKLQNGKTVLPMCINLERCSDRRGYITKCCELLDFPMNFLKAFDKNLLLDSNTKQAITTQRILCGEVDPVDGVVEDVTIVSVDPHYTGRVFRYSPPSKFCKSYKPYVHGLYLGAIGCALSHLECFRLLCESDADFALILEDDIAFFQMDYSPVLSKVTDYDFDICIVGTSPQSRYRESGGMNDGFVYETSKTQWYSGANAYMVSKNFANRLRPFDFVSCAADEFFGYAQMEMDARILAMNRPCFSLSDYCHASTNTPTN